MLSWTAVLVGGAAGSGIRYAVALALPARGAAGFPVATLTVNLLGCLLIGVAAALLGPSSTISPHLRLGILVGLLGGFTTFSSFGLETLRLIQSGHIGAAALYVGLSNLAGLAAVWMGARVGGGLPA
jgi:CrcB protein